MAVSDSYIAAAKRSAIGRLGGTLAPLGATVQHQVHLVGCCLRVRCPVRCEVGLPGRKKYRSLTPFAAYG
jgi:hypothetical protein